MRNILSAKRFAFLSILIAGVLMLTPALFNRMTPTIGSIPFFYWYQVVWFILSSVLIAISYHFSSDPPAHVPPQQPGEQP